MTGTSGEKRIPKDSNGQNISVENREKIFITGVLDVASFDDTFVEAETELGALLIRGENLKIERLSLEQHELSLTGYILACEYEDKKKASGKGILSRMFK